MDSDEEFGDTQSSALEKFLTPFLFGNIDKHGKLESDFLDDEAKKHVGSLYK